MKRRLLPLFSQVGLMLAGMGATVDVFRMVMFDYFWYNAFVIHHNS